MNHSFHHHHHDPLSVAELISQLRALVTEKERALARVTAEFAVYRWNKNHPIGTLVIFAGEARRSRSMAYLPPHGDRVVLWLEGLSDAVPLADIEGVAD